jgi:hypothetical protein
MDEWPEIALSDWLPTYATLHRWTQIVGKTRLALAPFENHWWHCTLYVSARGLTTSAMPFRGGNVEIEFDFLSDTLQLRTSEGDELAMKLESKPVAEFYADYCAMLAQAGVEARIHPAPNEVADATPFPDDRAHRTYDGASVRRCWRALAQANHALEQFRSGFSGKCSPSHFWWGGFDLSCTRFSGRVAPRHPGGIPNCPDYVTHEAYSHECISAGWWPGTPDSPVPYPAFYAYAYPEPAGCNVARIDPLAATYDVKLREWILPYDAVRTASDPAHMVADFFESTYQAAASLGHWDIAGLRSSRAQRSEAHAQQRLAPPSRTTSAD